MSEIKENKLVVSNNFVEIFKHFNVSDKTKEMRELSKRELYLLLTVCLDKHDDELPIVNYNFLPFRDEVMEINDVQDDKEITNQVILDLIKESDDKYIETDYIVDEMGNKLPDPFTKEEIRDLKIEMINGDN